MELKHFEEQHCKALPGLPILLFAIVLLLACIGGMVLTIQKENFFFLIAVGIGFISFILLISGIKVLKPNEAYVFTLFGNYYGTLKGPGIFFVNPFVSAVNPVSNTVVGVGKGKISLKAMTLSNEKQKINDQLGNPIIIGIIVIWRVKNTAQAVFGVENYMDYLSIQSDSSLRNIVRLYPYDVSSDGEEQSLRGSSQEIALRLKEEIQKRVEEAGIEVLDARITNLAYAPEIAQVMLQRQQASAIIDARKMIVEGAVSMVEMALSKLNEQEIVKFSDDQKAKMVSNLLVVLCGNKDAQPIISTESLGE